MEPGSDNLPLDYTAIKRDEVLPEPKIKTQGIDHIVLHVADVERSRKFYIELLGFKPWYECDRHVFLSTGLCQIGLFEARGGETIGAYTEMDHLALRCDASPSEIRGALKAAKIPLIPRPEGRGWPTPKQEGFYFRDPDGHIIQLLPKGRWPQVKFSGRSLGRR